MPNFSKSQAIVRTTSLENQVKQITGKSKNDTDTLMQERQIPDDVWQSMNDQGMTTQNAWSPGTPLTPSQPFGSEPRQFGYMIGENIVQRPRSTEAISFDTMKSVIDNYDIARMCIEVRLDELRNLDWDIVPYDENSNDAEKYSMDINKVRNFFEKPDGYTLFDDFQHAVAFDWQAYDALSIYPHLTRGGELGALEAVDGKSITPMIDYYGRRPNAPAPAYVQWMYGLPWTWLTKDQLIYRPYNVNNDSVYGTSPIEWMLTAINTDMRYQMYFLQYFTDGSIPDTWINAPESMKDPNQIKQFQEMYDAVMRGDQSQKHKALFIPFGSKVQQAKELKWDINFPQFMMQKTCAAFKVQPSEIGFTEKVNKSSGETQENVQYRRSIRPSAQFFQRIYTGIIHKYFQNTKIRFKFLNVEEQEDRLLMAQADEIYIKAGVISPDEVRVARYGYDVDPQNPVPRVFVNNRMVMPVQSALQQAALSNKELQAQIDQQEAQAQTMRSQAGLPRQDNADTLSQPDEDIVETDDEEMEAQKAALDFFVKSSGEHPNPNIQAWTNKFRPEVHKFLKTQSRHIAAAIRRHLERLGKANPKQPPNQEQTPPPAATSTAAEVVIAAQAEQQAQQILSEYQSESWASEATQLLQDFLVQIYTDAHDKAIGQMGVGFEVNPTFHLQAEMYAKERTASLVTRLDQSTRKMLKATLRNAMQAGDTPQEIERTLQKNYAFSDSRAETIARTETAFAWNHAGIKTYEGAGAKAVKVYDGDYDADCAEADGQVWSFQYAIGHRLEHPQCLIPGTRVLARNLEATFTRWYEGDVVVLRTSSDDEITVTPNHPILSNRGWIAAGELREGDYVVRDTSDNWSGCGSDRDNMPPLIEDVAKASDFVLAVVPTTSEDFHGDGTDGQVCIIGTNRFLSDGIYPAFSKEFEQPYLSRANIPARVRRIRRFLFQCDSVTNLVIPCEMSTAYRIVRGLRYLMTKRSWALRVSEFKRIRLTSHLDTHITKPPANLSGLQSVHSSDLIRRQLISDVKLAEFAVGGFRGRSFTTCTTHGTSCPSKSAENRCFADSVERSEIDTAFTCEIAFDKIIGIEREFYSGHVYNLQTKQGWYVANSIITHNCVRSFGPEMEDTKIDRGDGIASESMDAIANSSGGGE